MLSVAWEGVVYLAVNVAFGNINSNTKKYEMSKKIIRAPLEPHSSALFTDGLLIFPQKIQLAIVYKHVHSKRFNTVLRIS